MEAGLRKDAKLSSARKRNVGDKMDLTD